MASLPFSFHCNEHVLIAWSLCKPAYDELSSYSENRATRNIEEVMLWLVTRCDNMTLPLPLWGPYCSVWNICVFQHKKLERQSTKSPFHWCESLLFLYISSQMSLRLWPNWRLVTVICLLPLLVLHAGNYNHQQETEQHCVRLPAYKLF